MSNVHVRYGHGGQLETEKKEKKEACILCSVTLLCSARSFLSLGFGLVLKRPPPQSPQIERIDPPNPTAKLVIFSPPHFSFAFARTAIQPPAPSTPDNHHPLPPPSIRSSSLAVAVAADRAQAAREVCAASAAFASCTHRRRSSSPRGPHFVDWYLVLAIGEAASEEAVRRRYRQLALQLHPDKNRHPKAEVAFKIVSEAHACLTDQARRQAFDAERRGIFCAACHDRHSARWSKPPTLRTAAGATNHHAPVAAAARSSKAAREVQSRLRDECGVIEVCLRANDAAARARRRQSFPLFDPSDSRRFPDYPHVRPPPYGLGGAELRRSDERLGHAVDQAMNRRWCRDGSESPVYQIRTAATECTERRAW